jgi:hypothetical protein
MPDGMGVVIFILGDSAQSGRARLKAMTTTRAVLSIHVLLIVFSP